MRGEGRQLRSLVVYRLLPVLLAVALTLLLQTRLVALRPSFSVRWDPLMFGDGWQAADGSLVNTERLFELEPDADGALTLTKDLPAQLFEGDTLVFNGKNVDLELYVRGIRVYNFSATDPVGQGGLESYFHRIPLLESYAGGGLTLVVRPHYDDSSCFLADMAICPVSDYIAYYLVRYGLTFVMSIVIVGIGVALGALYFAIPRAFHSYDTLALGVASVCIGVWTSIETQVPMLLFGGLTKELLLLDYVSLYCVPYPLTVFVVSALRHRTRMPERVVGASTLACATAVTFASLTGLSDWHRMLSLFYVLLGILLASVVLAIIHSMRQARESHEELGPVGRRVGIAIAVLVVTILVSAVSYALSGQNGVDSAVFLRVGYIGMQLILLSGFVLDGNHNILLAGEAEAAHRLAVTDALTGIGNRAAFERACDAVLGEGPDARTGAGAAADGVPDDFLIACLDVDDLKRVNDTYGHEAGDERIRLAARLICEAFEPKGTCFRVGGDEFDVIIAGKDARTTYEEGLARLRALEARYAEEHDDAISISAGACLRSETKDGTIREVVAKADVHMYADKLARKGAVR